MHQWYFVDSLPLLAAYAWLIFRQTPDTRMAMRRTVILLTPWFYLFLLLSYWPDISREDDLPYVPLTPLSVIPLALLAGELIKDAQRRRKFLTYGLPAMACCVFLVTVRTHNVIKNGLKMTTRNIADVLLLTKPDDYVMDDKGDYIYRPRAYYWVLEPLTRARLRMGKIHDSIPLRLTEKRAKLCYLYCAREGSVAARFITRNYLPFDAGTRDMGVLGKVIGNAPGGGAFPFEITIPETYAVVAETGQAAGSLDGKPYAGAVWLAAGKHEFLRTAGGGRVAVFLGDAYSHGFLPLFKAEEKVIKEVGTLPKDKKKVELQ